LILTFLTPNRGKIAVMAKSAKKSKKRFAGTLEPFAVLEIVYSCPGRRRGLPILQEASLVHPFTAIRGNVLKTAYASYWAQLITEWTEQDIKEPSLFELYTYALAEMDRGEQLPDTLSVLFQIRFLDLAGLAPSLDGCLVCETSIDDTGERRIYFDLARGGVLCAACRPSDPSTPAGGDMPHRDLVREPREAYPGAGSDRPEPHFLSLGTIKPLLWMQHNDLKTAGRVRFTPRAAAESLAILEAFVPYHLGKDPRSLKFLQQIRK